MIDDKSLNAYQDLIEGGDYGYKYESFRKMELHTFCVIEAIYWLSRHTKMRKPYESAKKSFKDYYDWAKKLAADHKMETISEDAASYLAGKRNFEEHLKRGGSMLRLKAW